MNEEPSITASIFSRNIRKLRKMYDLTQKQFAERIGVTYSSASRYESLSDFRFPQPKTIDLIAQVFQVKISDLFSPDGAANKAKYLGL